MQTIVKKEKIKYPSSELLYQECKDDYMRLIKTYDQIYTKINIALAFCGGILIVFIGELDIRALSAIKIENIDKVSIIIIIKLAFIVVSVGLLIYAVIKCLLMIKSREVTVFDSLAIRSQEIYKGTRDQAALWLISNYTIAIKEIRTTIEKKEKEFDSVIIIIVISIILFVVYTVIKGVM